MTSTEALEIFNTGFAEFLGQPKSSIHLKAPEILSDGDGYKCLVTLTCDKITMSKDVAVLKYALRKETLTALFGEGMGGKLTGVWIILQSASPHFELHNINDDLSTIGIDYIILSALRTDETTIKLKKLNDFVLGGRISFSAQVRNGSCSITIHECNNLTINQTFDEVSFFGTNKTTYNKGTGKLLCRYNSTVTSDVPSLLSLLESKFFKEWTCQQLVIGLNEKTTQRDIENLHHMLITDFLHSIGSSPSMMSFASSNVHAGSVGIDQFIAYMSDAFHKITKKSPMKFDGIRLYDGMFKNGFGGVMGLGDLFTDKKCMDWSITRLRIAAIRLLAKDVDMEHIDLLRKNIAH